MTGTTEKTSIVASCFGRPELMWRFNEETAEGEALGALARNYREIECWPVEIVFYGHTHPLLARLPSMDGVTVLLNDKQEEAPIQAFGLDERGRIVVYCECSPSGNRLARLRGGKQHLFLADMVVPAEPIETTAKTLLDLEIETAKIFHEEINKATSDPFVTVGDLLDHEFELAPGIDQETYSAMCEKAVLIGLKDGVADVEICIASATIEAPAGIRYLHPSDALTTQGLRWLTAVLDICRPYGWSYDYNDGYHKRLSGYTRYPESLEIGFEKSVSAIDKARAMEDLAPFVAAHLPREHPLYDELVGGAARSAHKI